MDALKRLISCHLLVVLSLHSPQVESYGSGAPEGKCDDMTPSHGVDGQTTPSPYTLSAKLLNEESIEVTISSTTEFKGFFVQVRLQSDMSKNAPGAFTPDAGGLSQHVNCGGIAGSSLTHTSNAGKTELKVVWALSSVFDGSVVVLATVVQVRVTFWVKMQSAELAVKKTSGPAGEPETSAVPGATVMGDPKLYDKCGSSVGCYGIPANCISSKSCQILATYVTDATGVNFELYAFGLGDKKYAALGLSDDARMGDDYVVECLHVTSGQAEAKTGFNAPGYSNRRVDNVTGFHLLKTSVTDGNVYCNWHQVFAVKVENKDLNLKDKPYHLLIAMGSLTASNDKQKHSLAVPSGSPAKLSDVIVVAGSSAPLKIKLHGSIMVIAWFETASLGIMFARYFKHLAESTLICGVKIWFVFHRTLMATTVALALVALALIVIELKGWTQLSISENPHPIVGVVSIVLGVIQPIMAFFRPHPGTDNRPIFNWLHWAVGNLAQCLAAVAIYFSRSLNRSGLKDSSAFTYAFIGYIVFHVVVHIILQVYSTVVAPLVEVSQQDTVPENATSVVDKEETEKKEEKSKDSNASPANSLVSLPVAHHDGSRVRTTSFTYEIRSTSKRTNVHLVTASVLKEEHQ